ncbi:Uncharacterized protein APZ42_032486 [Daphnia magna]|uniref:Uncharacterized protein n=1 Tax=Daphnia magna TaxID=35525 RepID=A0A164LKJ8_9CRUS|nr:Uncharacterized protein APZ42_032486 [Daphnia magna]
MEASFPLIYSCMYRHRYRLCHTQATGLVHIQSCLECQRACVCGLGTKRMKNPFKFSYNYKQRYEGYTYEHKDLFI